jgi:hypothetical protein
MNVRFFAGTKADYLSLPTPRNPLGLYFCEDTQELFWADRLLTDGMRVVPTHADLPVCSNAADGVVYYVTETRNGYTLSPDRTEWLQTIYAPATDAYEVPESEIYNTVTTVGAVRDIETKIYKTIDERIANIEVGTSGPGVTAIYFAGRKLDSHEDGSYHIDRLCALKALGFVIPAGQDEFELVTKEYVDNQIKALTNIDLDEYAKKADIEGLATEEFVIQKITEAELANKDIDLTDYYTKSEVDAIIPAVDSFAKKDDVEEAIYNLEQDIRGRATEAFVKAEIEKIEIPKVPTKVSELENDIGYLTEHQDLSEYAKKTDLPSIEGLASEDFVRSEIAKAELNGGEVTEEELSNLLANYYSKTEIDNKIKDINIPSTEGFATEDFVKTEIEKINIPDTSNFITMEDVEGKGYLTEHQDLSHLATIEELQQAIDSIEHPSIDLSNYITKDEVAAVTLNQKYEVLYFDGALISYADNEVRVNTQHVDINKLPAQDAGDGSSDTYYYMTFRAYAPEGATSVIEGQSDKMDTEHSQLAIDSYGRKYTTIWAAIANKAGTTWSKFGDKSTVDKYLGFYYNFHWYANDKLIGMDKVRVLLTNDACHNDLVPDAVARRIDDKVAKVTTTVNNITEHVQNIEENYVTNSYITENYTTNEQLAATYVTNNDVTELVTQEVTTVVNNQIEEKVTEVIDKKVEQGTIEVKVDSISYGEF